MERGIIGEIEKNAIGFSLAFILLFTLSFVFLTITGMTPEAPYGSDAPIAQDEAVAAPIENPEEPVRVVARSVGMDITVSNPESTDIEVLDEALLHGSIRYPASGLLGVNGTVLLFGHSSYLPVVHNQAYKAFNRIQDLKVGETISVYSGTLEYRYKVNGVRVANAEEDVVHLPQDGKYLTLVTCDLSFGTKTSRYVVTADFVGTYAIASE